MQKYLTIQSSISAPSRFIFHNGMFFLVVKVSILHAEAMHGYEQSDGKTFQELPCSPGIAVAYASVNGKEEYIEGVICLGNILQFAQITFFFVYGVYLSSHAHYSLAPYGIVVGKQMCIPIVEVSCVEQAFVFHLHYPRHATVVASHGMHAYVIVLLYSSFCKPHVHLVLLCPSPFQDVAGQNVGVAVVGPLLSPLENLPREVGPMEMAA